MDADDTLEALVIAKRAYEEKLEPVMIPDRPFDVLTHQIVGLLMQRSKWMFDEILEILRKAYPYRNLSKKELESVLIYMHSRFPRLAWISAEDQIVLRPKTTRALYHYYFGKLSMITDQKQFLVIDESTDSPIGVLDEAFVAEYGGFNTKFIIRGSPWKMTMMSGDKIFARSIKDPTGAIPSWIGEEIPVPFEIAREVGQIRASIEKGIKKGKDKQEIVDELAKIYPSNEITIQRAIEETLEQIMQGHPIPSDEQIIIEDVKDYIIINAHLGTSVNRTLARLLAHVLSEQVGHMVGIQQDPYRIIIQTDGFFNSDNVSRVLADLASIKIEDLIKQASLKSGLFKRRMIQVAKRAGAISKRIKRSRGISLNRLLKSFEGTVILDEALKETYSKDLDLPNTLIIFEEIRLGKISIATIKANKDITPITRIGLERISRRTDLIPPEKIERILIKATEARILNEYKTIVCTNCWNQVKITQIKELPDKISCSNCSKPTIGMANESEETINKIIQKSKAHLSSKEKNLLENILETSNLIKEYGKVAVYALSGKRIEISDAYEILNQVSEISPDLFKLIMKAEKEALTKGFW
jgi:ATP-dependent Lhr-like helicase